MELSSRKTDDEAPVQTVSKLIAEMSHSVTKCTLLYPAAVAHSHHQVGNLARGYPKPQYGCMEEVSHFSDLSSQAFF